MRECLEAGRPIVFAINSSLTARAGRVLLAATSCSPNASNSMKARVSRDWHAGWACSIPRDDDFVGADLSGRAADQLVAEIGIDLGRIEQVGVVAQALTQRLDAL